MMQRQSCTSIDFDRITIIKNIITSGISPPIEKQIDDRYDCYSVKFPIQ